MLPNPLDIDKYLYVNKTSVWKNRLLYSFGLITWFIAIYGFFQLFQDSIIYTYIILPLILLFTFYHIVAFGINLCYKKFDLNKHSKLIRKAKNSKYNPSVDIYLPICGEDIDVLENTWKYVSKIKYNNKKVYVLDDSKELCSDHKKLAEKFEFIYIERPNKGETKKAGNLKYAFERTDGDFITIFDADFAPHKDFLLELLPYMMDRSIGIVQSPQYFDTSKSSYKNSPLAYAGAYREEIFYRITQVARDRFDAAICCGSNAIYRREALLSIGGPKQVTASEDSRTGFALLNNGWKTRYIPVILAIGMCPDNIYAYFHQQHRWVRGRSELVLSSEFRNSKLSWKIKLCNISGFLSFVLRPLELILSFQAIYLLFLYNQQANFNGAFLLFFGWVFYSFILYPLYHLTPFKKEVFFASMIQIVASTHSVVSVIMGKSIAWIPTNAKHTTISNAFTQGILILAVYVSVYLGALLILIYNQGTDIVLSTDGGGVKFWIVWNVILAVITLYSFLKVRAKVLDKTPLSNNLLHQILSTIAIAFVGIFAIWWFQLSRIPNNFQGIWQIFDILLFLGVSYIVWHPIVMTGFNWLVASHIKTRKTPKPKKGLKVAFLTTFVPASESIDLLHQCLPAMVSADYPHDTWLLDEGNSKEAQAICKQYGVKYFTRNGLEHYNQESGKFKAKTKGGNHNAWHDSHGHNYDIIAQIDTDFIPNANFLTQTLGYFNNPKVGFVVTPQIYGNTDTSYITKGAAEKQYNFYGHILRGLDGMKMNTLIGANHVVRVKALESINYYTAHITEDLITGMELHAQGWESVYVPEVLAIGEGPSTWKAYFNQQMRWAYGCIDILFNHSFKLFQSMTLRQKAYYFILQQHYFTGIVSVLGIIGLILYFFFGLDIARIDLIPFLTFYLPIIGIMELISFWLQKFNVRPNEERGMLWAGRVISIATWPIFFLALIGVLRRKNLKYKVTPKGAAKQVIENSLYLFIPHFIFATIALLSFVSAFFTGRDSIVLMFWALITFVTMSLIPFSDNIAQFTYTIYKKVTNNMKLSGKASTLTYFIVPSTIAGLYLFLYINVFSLYNSGAVVSSDLGIEPIQFATTQPSQPEEEVVTEASPSNDIMETKPTVYIFTASSGDGVTQLARKGVEAYIKDNNVTLSDAQKVFVETTLKNIYYKKELDIGEEISFESSVIADTISKANALTPAQINAWSKYL
jgi:cellulose synthase/poly-beta-1,6-N-acetylglucosamine synthase-like glycosyltransferase